MQVAEKHYLDVARGIPRDARTLDAAMQIEALLGRVIEAVSGAQQPAPQRVVMRRFDSLVTIAQY